MQTRGERKENVHMHGNAFDHIAQELFKQKQHMDHLEEENRALRRLLADLRAGRGIQVEIAGSRFVLRDDSAPREPLAPPR